MRQKLNKKKVFKDNEMIKLKNERDTKQNSCKK